MIKPVCITLTARVSSIPEVRTPVARSVDRSRVCYAAADGQECTKTDCRFNHDSKAVEEYNKKLEASRAAGNNGRSDIICEICTKRGHATTQCWTECAHCQNKGHRQLTCYALNGKKKSADGNSTAQTAKIQTARQAGRQAERQRQQV
jgi:hypothetical protein